MAEHGRQSDGWHGRRRKEVKKPKGQNGNAGAEEKAEAMEQAGARMAHGDSGGNPGREHFDLFSAWDALGRLDKEFWEELERRQRFVAPN